MLKWHINPDLHTIVCIFGHIHLSFCLFVISNVCTIKCLIDALSIYKIVSHCLLTYSFVHSSTAMFFLSDDMFVCPRVYAYVRLSVSLHVFCPCLPTCLSTCLSTCPSSSLCCSLSTCLSARTYTCPSTYLFVRQCVHMFYCTLFIHMFVYTQRSAHPHAYLSGCDCLSTHKFRPCMPNSCPHLYQHVSPPVHPHVWSPVCPCLSFHPYVCIYLCFAHPHACFPVTSPICPSVLLLIYLCIYTWINK